MQTSRRSIALGDVLALELPLLDGVGLDLAVDQPLPLLAHVAESARAHSYILSKHLAGTENSLILAVDVLAVTVPSPPM